MKMFAARYQYLLEYVYLCAPKPSSHYHLCPLPPNAPKPYPSPPTTPAITYLLTIYNTLPPHPITNFTPSPCLSRQSSTDRPTITTPSLWGWMDFVFFYSSLLLMCSAHKFGFIYKLFLSFFFVFFWIK